MENNQHIGDGVKNHTDDGTNKDIPFIEEGDVVQIDPSSDEVFGACFMIVTEVKQWGAQGYIQIPGKGEDGGRAYYRCEWKNMTFIGKAAWIWEYHGN